MKSNALKTLALSLMLALPGCGTSTIVASPSDCAALLPQEWKDGVAHTPEPDPAPAKPTGDPATASYWRAVSDWTLAELKKWTGFAVSEAANVEAANGRTADAIGIVSRCEARDAQAVKKARGWFD